MVGKVIYSRMECNINCSIISILSKLYPYDKKRHTIFWEKIHTRFHIVSDHELIKSVDYIGNYRKMQLELNFFKKLVINMMRNDMASVFSMHIISLLSSIILYYRAYFFYILYYRAYLFFYAYYFSIIFYILLLLSSEFLF